MQYISHGAFLVLVITLSFLSRCSEKQKSLANSSKEEAPKNPLFVLLSSEKTRVNFTNTLTESMYGNVLMYQYYYNGGGVAVGGINNNGRQGILPAT